MSQGASRSVIEVTAGTDGSCLVLVPGDQEPAGIAQALESAGLTAEILPLSQLSAAGRAWVSAAGWSACLQASGQWHSSELRSVMSWGHPELEIVTRGDGSAARHIVTLPGEEGVITTIGRLNGEADVQVDDRYVSSKHLQVRRRDGVWRVRDCGSRHGSTLNGKPLTKGGILRHRDEIRIGKTIIRFVSYDEEVWDLIPSANPEAPELNTPADPTGAQHTTDDPVPVNSEGSRWRERLVLLVVLLALGTCALVAWLFLKDSGWLGEATPGLVEFIAVVGGC